MAKKKTVEAEVLIKLLDEYRLENPNVKVTIPQFGVYTKSKIYTHCPTCRRLLYRTGANTFKEVNGIWYVKQCQKCATSSATHEKALSTRGPVISECPEIKDWWDYDKNSIIPDNLTRGSHYNAFLKCPACKADFKRSVHSFIATHRDGHLRPVACPECGYSSKGNPEDNLVKICPDIVNWWDYEANKPFVPEQFSRGSQYRAHLALIAVWNYTREYIRCFM